MKCRLCNTEMIVDKVVEKTEDNVAQIYYKCPNKQCANYGYKEKPAEKTE